MNYIISILFIAKFSFFANVNTKHYFRKFFLLFFYAEYISIEYADDTDFNSKSRSVIEDIKAQSGPIFTNWKLAVNRNKTEETTLKRGATPKEEAWRSTKKLGTFLGDCEAELLTHLK